MDVVEIPNTLLLVANYWRLAEENLRRHVLENCVNKGEEFITESFHAQFAAVLREASDQNLIAQAFLEDLEQGLPGVHSLQQIASGIVAEATLHNKATEKKTGGDLGLVVLRPALTYGWSTVKIEDYI